jgi:hypothetical protein
MIWKIVGRDSTGAARVEILLPQIAARETPGDRTGLALEMSAEAAVTPLS